jgi:hypothetical protein
MLVTGCNAVLGVEDLPGGTHAASHQEAGATFTYADADCQRCVETSCSAEEQGCGRDGSCTDLYDCVAARPLDDLAEPIATANDGARLEAQTHGDSSLAPVVPHVYASRKIGGDRARRLRSRAAPAATLEPALAPALTPALVLAARA